MTACAISGSTRISDSYTKYGSAFCVTFGIIAGYETAGAAEEAGIGAILAKFGDRAIANAEIPRGKRPPR